MRNERRKSGYWWAFSDAKGIDRAYAKVGVAAEKELAETLAGPQAIHETPVARDDTALKNPDGEFEDPAAMGKSPADRAVSGWDSRGDRFKDTEGQQGSSPPRTDGL
jgi:hypothetical protein